MKLRIIPNLKQFKTNNRTTQHPESPNESLHGTMHQDTQNKPLLLLSSTEPAYRAVCTPTNNMHTSHTQSVTAKPTQQPLDKKESTTKKTLHKKASPFSVPTFGGQQQAPKTILLPHTYNATTTAVFNA